MILLVGPLAVLPAFVAVVLLAALQWVRLSPTAGPPPPALVTGAAVAVGWTVLVVVLRFAVGV